MDEQPSITRFLVLGALETILNQMLDMSPEARERLKVLHGTVIRVRIERPMAVLYLLVYEDGVEVMQDYEGHVDLRVRAPMGALLHWLAAPDSPLPDDEGIRLLGPEELIRQLNDAMNALSIWEGLRQWLEHHVRLDRVLSLLRREDPEWLVHLQGLPGQLTELSRELARQRLLQEDILEEIRSLKTDLRRERRLDMAMLVLGLGCLVAALATATGHPALPVASISADLQTLLLASLGLTLIFSRVLFGHRYD
jgi:ubiquinone biosynthesis protein UbiJ